MRSNQLSYASIWNGYNYSILFPKVNSFLSNFRNILCPYVSKTGHDSGRFGLPIGLYISLVALGLGSGMGAGHQSKHGVNGNDGGTAVADQRQCQADNGHNTDTHANIDHDLENQRGCGAEADKPAHIVLTPGAYLDTPGNQGKLHKHDHDTAEEAQLLTHGGEDIVRVLGKKQTALCTVAGEQTLTRQTAAGQGQKIDLIVIPGTDTLRIESGIDQNQNALLLVFTHDLPEDGPGHDDQSNGQRKPKHADTAGESHADEDEHEDQGNARVAGQHHVQANQKNQVEYHMENRLGRGYPALVGAHDRRHNDNIGDLADLRRLDHNWQAGNIQPASVAGIIVRAEGDQHQKQQGIEDHQQIPPLRQHFNIDGGNQNIGRHTHEGSRNLDNDIAGAVEVEFRRVGGAGDGDTAKSRNQQAQHQQDNVALFPEIFQFVQESAHPIASFLAWYYSIFPGKSK